MTIKTILQIGMIRLTMITPSFSPKFIKLMKISLHAPYAPNRKSLSYGGSATAN